MRLNRSLSPLSCLLRRALFTLKAAQPKNQAAPPRAAPPRTRAPTRMVQTRHAIMQSRKGQARIHMEKTNQPILQSLKGQARTRTEKTHHVITITQGRKDQAQPGSL